MAFDVIGSDRLERAVADVQRNAGDGDPRIGERVDEWDIEVQPGCRRGNGTTRPRKPRLVPLTIGIGVRTMDVWRQWKRK